MCVEFFCGYTAFVLLYVQAFVSCAQVRECVQVCARARVLTVQCELVPLVSVLPPLGPCIIAVSEALD